MGVVAVVIGRIGADTVVGNVLQQVFSSEIGSFADI